jgi:hypothetical protein
VPVIQSTPTAQLEASHTVSVRVSGGVTRLRDLSRPTCPCTAPPPIPFLPYDRRTTLRFKVGATFPLISVMPYCANGNKMVVVLLLLLSTLASVFVLPPCQISSWIRTPALSVMYVVNPGHYVRFKYTLRNQLFGPCSSPLYTHASPSLSCGF